MARSCRNAQARQKTKACMRTKRQDWKLFKGVWISTAPVLPGVWERREGGHVVRARAKNSTTGKLKDIFKVLPESSQGEALAWLENEQRRARAGIVASAKNPRPRFAEFAASLFEHKVKIGEIRSAKGREKWATILEHLIGGTEGATTKKFVRAFGDYFVDMLRVEHVEAWKSDIAELIAAGDYSPVTVNGWLSVLRVIMKEARRRFGLTLMLEDVTNFDTSEVETYSEEEPNSLTPEEIPLFLESVRKLYPQHYAMTFIGFITGLRPSSMRPLRRSGDETDVQWEKSRILIRRSQTIGEEVMRTTKTKRRYPIHLPEEAMNVLRWHVDTQLVTPEMQDSNLLFPSVTGGYRSPNVLNKPFEDVMQTLGLKKRLTQRGLRRTFQDLSRAAEVEGIITRSISGHATEEMQEHYSTVHGAEQKAALAKVISICRARGGEVGGESRLASGEGKRKAG